MYLLLSILQRDADSIHAVPILAIISILGPSTMNVIIAVAFYLTYHFRPIIQVVVSLISF